MIRGLFEYLYRADGLTILPHIPTSITRLEQHFPIRFGTKQLYLATAGQGPITSVAINGKPWKTFDPKSITLPYDQTPDEAVIEIALGGAKAEAFRPQKTELLLAAPAAPSPKIVESLHSATLAAVQKRVAALAEFNRRLVDAGLGQSYEAAHARLAVACMAATVARQKLLADGKLARLPAASQTAADKSYVDTVLKLCDGLEKMVKSYPTSDNPQKKRIWQIWSHSS